MSVAIGIQGTAGARCVRRVRPAHHSAGRRCAARPHRGRARRRGCARSRSTCRATPPRCVRSGGTSSAPAPPPPPRRTSRPPISCSSLLRRNLAGGGEPRLAREPRRRSRTRRRGACAPHRSRKERAHDRVRDDRAGLGLLLRAVRSAAVAVRGLAAELRPDRARLLSDGLRRARRWRARCPPRRRSAYMRTGFSPATFRRGHPASPARAAAQPVPARSSSLTTGSSTRGRSARCCTRSATTCKTTSASRRAFPRSIGRRSREAGFRAAVARDVDTVEPRDCSPTSAACCSAARPSSAR